MMTGNILWFLLIGAFIYFMMRNGGGCCSHRHNGSRRHDPHSDTEHSDNPQRKQNKGD